MFTSLIKPLVASSCLLICSQLAIAQSGNSAPVRQTGWSFSGHADHVNIDKEAAAEQWIEDSAFAIGGAAEYYSSDSENTLTLGASILFYRDNAEFSQYVEDWWGYEDYEESDANAFMLFAEYGPKYRFGQDNMSFFSVRGGVSGILGSERSISNCSNCYSEDIEIDGGVYGVLGVGQTLGSIDVSLQFQQYFSGDLNNVFRLKISGAF